MCVITIIHWFQSICQKMIIWKGTGQQCRTGTMKCCIFAKHCALSSTVNWSIIMCAKWKSIIMCAKVCTLLTNFYDCKGRTDFQDLLLSPLQRKHVHVHEWVRTCWMGCPWSKIRSLQLILSNGNVQKWGVALFWHSWCLKLTQEFSSLCWMNRVNF